MMLYPASIQTIKKIKTHRVDVIEDVELFCSSSGGIFENEDDAGDFFRFHPVKKEGIHQEKVCWVDVDVNISSSSLFSSYATIQSPVER